jgi:chromosomal replication initiator protein
LPVFLDSKTGSWALFLVLLLDGFCVASNVFTIPLGGVSRDSLVSAAADISPIEQGDRIANTPHQYVGSDENRLVDAAVNTLFSSNHATGRVTPDSINPMVFFGPAGSGKSLLVLGAADRWQAQFPSDDVVTLTGVDLVHKLTEAIQVNSVDEFTAQLTGANLLVMDDVHVIAGRGTGEEFLCGVLDTRRAASLPTLISLDQSPASHDRLSQRLAGRLLAGLSIPLVLPGQEALKLILIQLASRMGLDVDDSGCQRMLEGSPSAGMVFQTPRQLRQAVVWLSAAGHSLLDTEAADTVVAHFCRARRATLKFISSLVGRRFNVTLGQLQGASRKQGLVRARSVAMLLAKRHSGLSYVQIGKYFGGRDHSTVIHACRRTETRSKDDSRFHQSLGDLDNQILESLSLE